MKYDTPQINAVSFSRMSVFEQCPYRALLSFAQKIQEPMPPPEVETPLQRGSRVHEAAEHYIKGIRPDCIPELRNFEDDLANMRARFSRRRETIWVEEMWCFDKDWQPVGQWDFDTIWVRVKQDAVVRPRPERIVCIDFKTGRKDGNEVKHNTQLRVAALGAFFKFPDAEEFVIENWYTDHKDLDLNFTQQEYTRPQIMEFFDELDGRLRAVTDCTEFEPTPSRENCRFCYLKSGQVGRYIKGTGDCAYAYPG